MSWLARLIERQIKKAQIKGDLQNLKGEGEPLPDRTGDAFIDPSIAAGFRIMSEAGVVPEEITLKKRIAKKKAELREIFEPDKRKIAMAELAELEMRKAIAEEARKKFIG